MDTINTKLNLLVFEGNIVHSRSIGVLEKLSHARLVVNKDTGEIIYLGK